MGEVFTEEPHLSPACSPVYGAGIFPTIPSRHATGNAGITGLLSGALWLCSTRWDERTRYTTRSIYP